MEAIIQKAAELGASCIVPLISERVVPQIEYMTSAHRIREVADGGRRSYQTMRFGLAAGS